MVLAGRMEEADSALNAAQELASELGQPTLRWAAGFLRTGRAIIAGTLEVAEQLAVEFVDIGLAGGRADAAWAFAQQLFLIRAAQGRIDQEVAAALERVADEIKATGARLEFAEVAAALAAAELGRSSEARAVLDDVASRQPIVDYYSILHDELLSQLTVRLSEAAYAEVLYRRLRPYPDWVVPFGAFPAPSVSFHLGLLATFLGWFDDAEVHFVTAAADHERIGAPAFLARTRLEWARMLLSRGEAGDLARARPLLEAALGGARDLGLLGVERDAAALLGD
jgi:hypothetical protein